ncbi:MAG TPA: D-alanyl-D-alanine endopeptidase [Casimicrobiaceae bacterium]|nr:D-alanyl-D-alanine endopeptidase [Casimicrobiaceae bacterium]
MDRLLALVFACLVAVPAWGSELSLDPAKLKLKSANVLVIDASADTPIYSKAADEVTPIASVTKLMTAMVVLDGGQPLDEELTVSLDDFDFLKGSGSRLRMGTVLTRREMLQLALMSSENRAASALARYYPGGRPAFVEAMNAKAQLLGMSRTHYADSTGLSPDNVSTANDLAKLVRAASDYALIREFSTTPSHYVELQPTGKLLGFNNSNGLVKSHDWDIQLQKTGYIREAGKCLVMMATIASRPMVIVLLDSLGQYTRIADAQRVKHWLETGEELPVRAAKAAQRGVRNAVAAVKGKRVKGSFEPRLARSGKSGGA